LIEKAAWGSFASGILIIFFCSDHATGKTGRIQPGFGNQTVGYIGVKYSAPCKPVPSTAELGLGAHGAG
jgi:hypothetical protein